jgi:hypothetical protein
MKKLSAAAVVLFLALDLSLYRWIQRKQDLAGENIPGVTCPAKDDPKSYIGSHKKRGLFMSRNRYSAEEIINNSPSCRKWPTAYRRAAVRRN